LKINQTKGMTYRWQTLLQTETSELVDMVATGERLKVTSIVSIRSGDEGGSGSWNESGSGSWNGQSRQVPIVQLEHRYEG
jgi:hypothetical protein